LVIVVTVVLGGELLMLTAGSGGSGDATTYAITTPSCDLPRCP